MSSTQLTTWPLWTAAGWTMLHLVWVGAVVGLLAALMRRLLKTAHPETRYGASLACLLALSVSPVVILVRVFEPESVSGVSIIASAVNESSSLAMVPSPSHPATTREVARNESFNWPASVSTRSRVDFLVTYLPGFWLCGSLFTLTMLATGLLGVEQMRRSSRLVESSDLRQHCCALAKSLGIARLVSVAMCDRLAMPLLIGIVRPMILLPPAAISGWSVEQLEMVLLHELAHLRRWDNLVNLLQRLVESLLFFHPVVWWISGWVRLERELCCDRLVVERVGRPVAYAEMLVALAGSNHRGRQTVLAMADRQVLTRIRRLLNLEERSMKLSVPEGLGLLGLAVTCALLVVGLQAAPVNDANETMQQAAGTAVKETNDKPELETDPPSEQAVRQGTITTTRQMTRVTPKSPRSISLFRRDKRPVEIVTLPRTSDGKVAYQCRGGIKIICKSQKFGTIRMEADEAVIKRVDRGGVEKTVPGLDGDAWVEEAEVPTEVDLKGNVTLTRDGVQGTVRASRATFDFVASRVVTSPAGVEAALPRLDRPRSHIKGVPGDLPRATPDTYAPAPSTSRDGTNSGARSPGTSPAAPVPAINQRTTSVLARGTRRLEVTQLAETIEGVVTVVFRGGIRIVSKSPRFGTVDMEADEAVIVRNLYRRNGETHSGPEGATWVEEDELPMRVHLKGEAILRQDHAKPPAKDERRTFRARELDYNFVTDRVVAQDAEVETIAPGAAMPIKIVSPLIEQFHPVVRQPDGSLAPSEDREIHALMDPSSPSTKAGSQKTKKP